MYWYPQALFEGEQACRRRFIFMFEEAALFFQTCPSSMKEHMSLLKFSVFLIFENTK